MASLTDILTTAKNIVTAINGLANTYLNVMGAQNQANIIAATLIKSGSGRVGVISIINGGSAAGYIYDANSAGSTTNPIFAIPTTIGVVVLNMPVNNGIFVAPGTGQAVTISYS
jgi:hypothetical protein